MKATLLALLCLTLFIGCEDDESSVTAPSTRTVTIIGLPDSLSAPVGTEVVLPFDILIRNSSETTESNVRIDLTLLAGQGEITPARVTTDSEGRASARLKLTIPLGGSRVEMLASATGGSANPRIKLFGTGIPTSVNLAASALNVAAPRGTAAQVNFTATVVDAAGGLLFGIPMRFSLQPADTAGSGIFGAISGDATTNKNGVAAATFTSLGASGRVVVHCAALNPNGSEAIFTDQILEVRYLEATIGNLILTLSPDYLTLEQSQIGRCTARATVITTEGAPVVGLPVQFRCGHGIIARQVFTGQDGVAAATYTTAEEADRDTIAAFIAGTPFGRSALLTINWHRREPYILTISADRSFIYADNGLTTANLTMILKDRSRQAVPNAQLTLSSTHGAVNSSVSTNSLGVASALFTDIGLPSIDPRGNIVPAIITVCYPAGNVEASCEVTILEKAPVDRITLMAAASHMIVGRQDSTPVRAACFLMNGDFALNGTLVRFEVDNGSFTREVVPVSGNYGVAETQFISGNMIRTAHLQASVVNEDSTVYSNIVEIRILPGPPARIRLSADGDWTTPGLYFITATITDLFDNPIPEVFVRFTTTMGYITPPLAITDTLGRARVRLSSGVAAGVAEVTATVGSPTGDIIGRITVNFVSGSPNSLELTANPLRIYPAGMAVNTSSTLRAVVRDANGNPVETPTTVVFELLREPPEPAGCNFNNRGQRDSTLMAAGIAVATLNAGTHIGGKLIRAYTWRDPETRRDTVQNTISTIAVSGGPPAQLDLDISTVGEDIGGGLWRLPLSVRIWDTHRNPSAYDGMVMFSVDPPAAQIESARASNGIAHSYLVYNSANTFTHITITVSVMTVNGALETHREFVIPLQRGRLELAVDPGNFMFDRGNPNLTCNIRCWATLTDGHGILIDGAPVLFRSNRARFYWYNMQTRQYVGFGDEPVRRFTSLVDARNNEPQGVATVFLRGIMDDFFLDPFTLEVTVQVSAMVEGFAETESRPAFIFMNRH
ncbi:MAG: hypothetical protein FJY65_00735 [Calditrichaeota bacterium]|nr:hypothetical protein [Calditrichota bacterium]